jgi:hypothetical protein
MVYSLEFSNLQRDALEAEFLYPAPPESRDKPGSVERSTKAIPVAYSRGITNISAAARVKAYLAEHPVITQAELAERAHIADTTLRHLLKTGHASRRTWIEVAAAVDLTSDELLRSGK